MHNSTRLTLATIALVSGISVAAAAPAPGSASTTSSESTAKDSLSLTQKQKQTAWRDISGLAMKVKPPSGFTARVGITVPNQITTHPMPVSTANKVPELRPYRYAMLDNNAVLVINPDDKKIAAVITK